MRPCAAPRCPTPTDGIRCPAHRRRQHLARDVLPWLMLVMLRKASELQKDAQVGGSIREQIAVRAHVVSILSLLGFSPDSTCPVGLGESRDCQRRGGVANVVSVKVPRCADG